MAPPPKGERCVTVTIGLTPVRDEAGTARLLDMVEGRSKAVFTTWLNARDQAWREGIEVIAINGLTGFKTAAVEKTPKAVTVMDPPHLVHLAADAPDECRRRTQQDIVGRRGRATDPLYRERRSLHTKADLLTDKQKARLRDLFADERHTAVEVTWGVYQRMTAAHRDPDRAAGKATMTGLIRSISTGVSAGLDEVARLGRTRKERAEGVLAFSTGPARPTASPRRSVGAWITGGASPWAFATSPTTPPAASSKPAGSDKPYTVNPETSWR